MSSISSVMPILYDVNKHEHVNRKQCDAGLASSFDYDNIASTISQATKPLAEIERRQLKTLHGDNVKPKQMATITSW